MKDLFIITTLYFTFLSIVLYLGFKTWNPIKQITALKKNPGIAAGVVIVSSVFLGLVVFTNKVDAAEYRYEMEVGLDRPFGENNIGCVYTGDQTASNINLRALSGPALIRYGLLYNHQSCAANTDKDTSDWIGPTLMYDHSIIRIEVAAQIWKHSETRYPITWYTKIYTHNQFRYLVFVQRQYGSYEESSYGMALNWRF